MDVIIDADVLVDGTAKGDILKLSAPISFWGGIDPMAGKIANPQHPDHGALVTGKVLAIPRIIGSSSSSQLLLELLYRQTAPAAILLGAFDAIIGTAAAERIPPRCRGRHSPERRRSCDKPARRPAPRS